MAGEGLLSTVDELDFWEKEIIHDTGGQRVLAFLFQRSILRRVASFGLIFNSIRREHHTNIQNRKRLRGEFLFIAGSRGAGVPGNIPNADLPAYCSGVCFEKL